MLRYACILAVLSLVAGPLPAHAGEHEAADGRYDMIETDEGFLRLDTRTGEVSVCRLKTTDWACEVMADERAAMEDEINRLTQENTALRDKLSALQKPAEPARPQESVPPASKPKSFDFQLPDEQDMEKIMSFFQDMMRRFMDMVKTMKEEQKNDRT